MFRRLAAPFVHPGALLLALIFPFPAFAAIRTVGPVSCAYTDLASAVTAASPGDEIRIHKDYALPTNVRIEKSLTIIGGLPHCFAATPESDTSISVLASASPAPRRVLDVRGTGVEVTLYHLHLSGALNAGGLNVQGGAMVRAGGVEISGNSALLGGGVWVHGAASELHAILPPFSSALPSLVVEENEAMQGGGIYLGSATRLLTSAQANTLGIRHNTALDIGASSGRGGGLYLQAGATAAGINSLVGNLAELGGGAYLEGRAAGSSMPAGADFEVVGSVAFNRATDGAGLYVAASDAIEVRARNLLQNRATRAGGGLWFGSQGSISVDIFEDNLSNGVGAGAYQSAGLLRIRQHLVGNVADSHGGGVYAIGGERRFDGGIQIGHNRSSGNGGALWVDSAGGTMLPGDDVGAGRCDSNTQCRIHDNKATGDGGAFYLVNTSLLMQASSDGSDIGLTVINNESGASGGAIFAADNSEVRVLGSVPLHSGEIASRWAGNTAVTVGGAIALSNSDLVISEAIVGDDNPVLANTAQSGGAFYIAGTGGSSLQLELRAVNLRMNGNHADLQGGAIFASGGARIEVGTIKCASSVLPADRYCSEISGNHAAEGAAIFTLGAVLDISTTAIVDNTGTDFNSAALLLNGNGDDSILESVLFANNQDHAIRIDDLAFSGSRVLLDSATVVDHPGAAIVLADEPGVELVLANSLIWNNVLASVDGTAGSATASQTCSLLGGGELGALGANPLLISNPRGNYRLGDGSPAIDACLSGAFTDLDGNPRDSMPDIGAFEFGGLLPPVLFSDGFESP